MVSNLFNSLFILKRVCILLPCWKRLSDHFIFWWLLNCLRTLLASSRQILRPIFICATSPPHTVIHHVKLPPRLEGQIKRTIHSLKNYDVFAAIFLEWGFLLQVKEWITSSERQWVALCYRNERHIPVSALVSDGGVRGATDAKMLKWTALWLRKKKKLLDISCVLMVLWTAFFPWWICQQILLSNFFLEEK